MMKGKVIEFFGKKREIYPLKFWKKNEN